MKLFFIPILLLTFTTSSFAWKSKADLEAEAARAKDSMELVQLKQLQREVETLTRIRLAKADSLEKKEAEHWRKRYAESKLTEDHQTETRELDGRYSKLSTDLGRVTEELMASKNVTNDGEEQAKSEESSYDAVHTQIKLSVDKTVGEVPGDYPVDMNDRLIRLRKAQEEGDRKKANTVSVLQIFLEDQLKRHEKTYTQTMETRNSQVGNRAEVSVERLRLGTIFLGEVALDSKEVQVLFRTGTLQGKMYEWNNALPANIAANVRTTLEQGKSTAIVSVPIDILQNKAVKNSIAETKDLTWQQEFQDWFKKGGIVMYPLFLVAIISLLLCLERFLVFVRRGHASKSFTSRIDQLIEQGDFEKAASICLKKDTSLSMVMFSVINKAKETRDDAEKALQEALLREQPKLDRRMGLLSAMGTIAPLLGLLGTVTGIITLFTVITEVGTNDAKVLAGGISEALITTETGLIIAIPVMILHGILSEKLEQVNNEMYIQSTALLNKIFSKKN